MSVRYSVYLLYWYKCTNTDALHPPAVCRNPNAGGWGHSSAPGRTPPRGGAGTQFACFTSTKVQILTHDPPRLLPSPLQRASPRAQFTCFTSTKVRILTPVELQRVASYWHTCRDRVRGRLPHELALVLSLLALPVQKYKD
jgi:hypothetical protein